MPTLHERLHQAVKAHATATQAISEHAQRLAAEKTATTTPPAKG